MTSSDDLYKLIKSLNKTEKRYFTLSSSLYERETTYMKLFQLIDAQSEYNEEVLKEALQVNQFSVIKTRLFQLILNSLGSLQADKSVDAAIRENLIQARILQEKNMIEASVKLYDKARIRAFRHGRYELVLEALRLYPSRGLSEHDLWMHHGMETEILAKIQRVGFLRKSLNYLQAMFVKNGFCRSTEDFENYSEFRHHNEVRCFDEKLADAEEKYYYHKLFAWYYFIVFQPERAHDHLLKLMYFIEEENLVAHDSLWQERKGTVLLLYLRICVYCGRDIERELIHEEIEKHQFFAYQMDELYSVQLEAKIRCGELDDDFLIQFAEKYVEEKHDEEKLYHHYFTLLIQLARFYFITGDFKKSSRYSMLVVNNKYAQKSSVYFTAVQLNILTNYCKGNVELIESSLRSFARKLQHEERKFEFEKLFISLMKKLQKSGDSQEEQILLGFREKFVALMNDNEENKAMIEFNMLQWIDSRLQRLPMQALILRENLLQLAS